MTHSKPIWVVTGASSGIGQAIALAAAAQSAHVVAIGRHAQDLQTVTDAGCHPLLLDIAGPVEDTKTCIQQLLTRLGPVDVLVNAAGYLLEGGVEETSDEETFDIFNTNVFAPMRLARAVLPGMRDRRRGAILNIAGLGAYRGSPNAGAYCATKAALTTLTEALQQEAAPLGVQVCLVQLGHFRTNFLGPGHRRKVAGHIADYDAGLAPLRKAFDGLHGAQPGDPAKAGRILVDLVMTTMQQEGQQHPPPPPLPAFLPLGSDVAGAIRGAAEARAEQVQAWKHLSDATDL